MRHLLMTVVLSFGMAGAGLIMSTSTASGANNGTPPGCTKNGHPNGPPCGPPCGKTHGNPYPGRKCQMTTNNSAPTLGETITVFGEGYRGNSPVDLSIQSTPTHLVTAQTDANGDYSQDVTIPCGTALGDHTIFGSGVNPDSEPFTLSVGINVQNASCVLGTQTTATTVKTNNGNGNANEQARGALPFTGNAATALLVTLAIGLITAGGIAVSAARRRENHLSA